MKHVSSSSNTLEAKCEKKESRLWLFSSGLSVRLTAKVIVGSAASERPGKIFKIECNGPFHLDGESQSLGFNSKWVQTRERIVGWAWRSRERGRLELKIGYQFISFLLDSDEFIWFDLIQWPGRPPPSQEWKQNSDQTFPMMVVSYTAVPNG